MKKKLAALVVIVFLVAVPTVFASPFGLIQGLPVFQLIWNNELVKATAVEVDGRIYIPLDVVKEKFGGFTYVDKQGYKAYYWTEGSSPEPGLGLGNASLSPFEDIDVFFVRLDEEDEYSVALLLDDLSSLKEMVESFLSSTQEQSMVVYHYLNRKGNYKEELKRVLDRWEYREDLYDKYEDRIERIQSEIREILGSSQSRDIYDLDNQIERGISYKDEALDYLIDWVESGDRDDYDDYIKYNERANKAFAEALLMVEEYQSKVYREYNRFIEDSFRYAD